MVAHYYNPGYWTVRSRLLYEGGTVASACPPDCRVRFLAEIYGLIPWEVALITLISSGKSGRAISQRLGVGMPMIRQYCGWIHNKIGTRSRLGIGFRDIRRQMVDGKERGSTRST